MDEKEQLAQTAEKALNDQLDKADEERAKLQKLLDEATKKAEHVLSYPGVKRMFELEPKLENFPAGALEEFSKEAIIKKHKELGAVTLQTIIDKSLDWCPDLSTGGNVEFKADFTDKYGYKCWGMVKKGTTVKHGLVRLINPKNG